MTTYNLSVDFTDTQITGIAQARTAYNTANNTALTDIEYLEFVLLGAADSYASQYGEIPPVDPSPIEPVADWQALTDHILGGDLYSIYARLTAAQFVAYNPLLTPEENGAIIANANNIAVAAGKLDQAVAVTRVESAVAASFQLLITTSNYTFTQEEKDLWNPLVASLNFSPLVYLP